MSQPLGILRLQVPKNNEKGPVVFEPILASLHSFAGQKNIRVSFEIVQINRRIYFDIVAPKNVLPFLRSQIYGQFPGIEIQEIDNYFTKSLINGRTATTLELTPVRSWVFPFRRHPEFEDPVSGTFADPISSLLAPLSNVENANDYVGIQLVVAPIDGDWNSLAQSALRRFMGSWPWSTPTWQRWHQWAHLSPSVFKRKQRFWARWLMGILNGFGQSNAEKLETDLDKQSQSSTQHDRETAYSAGFDKLTRLNYQVNIRAVHIHNAADSHVAQAKMQEIKGAFQTFAKAELNSFTTQSLETGTEKKSFFDYIFRRVKKPMVLSQEELATLYHLPTITVTTPGIDWVESIKLEPPLNLPTNDQSLTLIGDTNFRTHAHRYGIKPDDRRRHVYVLGKTGMGKSTLLENMIFSDIAAGKGVGVIDPHGDLAEAVMHFVPKSRTNDVIVVDPSDREWPLAFNMLEGNNIEYRAVVASGLVGVFKKLYAESWGPRLEHFLRNTILALIEAPDTTMLGIPRMLVDKDYREKILHHVQDPMVLNFWRQEFSALPPAKLAEAIGPIQNKVGQFLSTPIIRNIVGQPKSKLDLRFAMDTGKIVIVNLSKGKIGEDNSSLLGSMLITKFQIDAMSRADIPESERRDFCLFIDEFQNFATDSFATILSEARKYRLALTMANQYLEQMSDEVAAAIFGNIGSIISFQTGIRDAKILSEQLDENILDPIHLASLPKYKIYNRIMVDGLTTPVFSANTLHPPVIPDDDPDRVQRILTASRERYAKPREQVEHKITRWSQAERDKKQKQANKQKDTKPLPNNTSEKKSDIDKKQKEK